MNYAPLPLRSCVLALLTGLALTGCTTAPLAVEAPLPVSSATTPAPQSERRDVPQRDLQKNDARHQTYLGHAKQGGIDLLIVGDSIVQGWPVDGKATWDKYYAAAPFKVDQFGVGYDRTQNVLWRLQNGEGQGFSPKVVELLIGTNNLGPNTPAETADGVTAVVRALRKDFPAAKILVLGILPRGRANDPKRQDIAFVNAIVAKLADNKHVFYLDLGSKLLDANGNFLPGVMKDNPPLHPANPGYAIWAVETKEILARLLK